MKAFKCLQCERTYSRRTRLNEHVKKIHGEILQKQRFLCPFQCPVQCRTMVHLLRHCEKEHKENLGTVTNNYTQSGHCPLSMIYRYTIAEVQLLH